MLGFILLFIFLFIVLVIVVLEIRNERKYQENRPQRRVRNKNDVDKKTREVQNNKVAPKVKPQKEEKRLPVCTYPSFTHKRLIEMGLTQEESREFVQELIPQLETQIPLIEEKLNEADFYQMERLTHSIKGSATNLGAGGVSDLLVECNTYLKTGTDKEVAKAYVEYLKHYTQELKMQYA